MVGADRPALRALASRLGVEDGYESALDGSFVATSDDTREALVRAMGFEAGSEQEAEQALAQLAPEASGPAPGGEPSCMRVQERLLEGRAFGVWTNLYSLRSASNVGFGNLADLRALVAWAAGQGAAFVGLNPLHALEHGADAFCPYMPVSRIFRDPLYLDPGSLPELAASADAQAALERMAGKLSSLRAAATLEPGEVEQALYAVLRPLHADLRAGRSPAHGARYRAWREAKGDALRDFATFQALADAQEAVGGARDWRQWPAGLRSPDAAAVDAFRRAHEAEVDFHAWLQFELEAQLLEVGREARGAGMAIGLYTDLALGSAAGGFDTWWRPDLFARGASVGAPPDAFSRAGQDWSFPPLDPHALRRDGFAFWRALLEANLCGAGALRIDHALGLRRLFWIPEGRSPREGAYVRSPEAGLLSVLCDTSRRLGALVIGEDLGTVPEGFSRQIQQRGLLSSRVLLFERDEQGFIDSRRWPALCLATLNTHDLPPLTGWLAGEDLALRRTTGQIPDDASDHAVRAERRADRDALRRRLEQEGDLPADADDALAWLVATTCFLCRTPAVLVGLSLDDLAGERVPINLPGVSPTRHRSWVRRMGTSLPAILESERTRRALDAIPVERKRLG